MPIDVVSCSRNMVCSAVNSWIEASSITALTWFSNSTGSTITLFARRTLNSAEADRDGGLRHFGDQHAPLVERALADQSFAEPQRHADGR